MKKGKIDNKERRQAEVTEEEDDDATDVSGSNVATIGSSQDIVTDPSLRSSESSLRSIDSVSDSSAAGVPATSTSNTESDNVFTSPPSATVSVTTPSAGVSSISENVVISSVTQSTPGKSSKSSADTLTTAERFEISTSDPIPSSTVDTPSSSDSLTTETSDISTSAPIASSTVGILSTNTLANVESIDVCSTSAPKASSTTNGIPPASTTVSIEPSDENSSGQNGSSTADISSVAEENSIPSISASTSSLTTSTSTDTNSTITDNLNATTSTMSNFVTAGTVSTHISPTREGTDESLSSPSYNSSNTDDIEDESNLSTHSKTNSNMDMPILRSMLSQPPSTASDLKAIAGQSWTFYEAQGYRRVSDTGSVRSRSPLSEKDSSEGCTKDDATDADENSRGRDLENTTEASEVNVRRMFDNMEIPRNEQATKVADNEAEIEAPNVTATTSGDTNTTTVTEPVTDDATNGATVTGAVDNAPNVEASLPLDVAAGSSTSDTPMDITETLKDIVDASPAVTTDTDSSCLISNVGSADVPSTQVALSCTIENITVLDTTKLSTDPPKVTYSLDPAAMEENVDLISKQVNKPKIKGNIKLKLPRFSALDAEISQSRAQSSECIAATRSPIRKRRYTMAGTSARNEVNVGASTSQGSGAGSDGHRASKRHRQHSVEGQSSTDSSGVIQAQTSEEKMDESKEEEDDVEKKHINKEFKK